MMQWLSVQLSLNLADSTGSHLFARVAADDL